MSINTLTRIATRGTVLPVEVKAGTQGGMKSLWLFMREKKLTEVVRCSLENFGSFEYTDQKTMAPSGKCGFSRCMPCVKDIGDTYLWENNTFYGRNLWESAEKINSFCY